MEHIGHYLKDIYFHDETGRLVFKSKGIQKSLFFLNGFFIFAQTNLPQERIGELLLKLGKISQEAYSNIHDYIKPTQKIGEILIERGHISQKDLHEALMYQTKEIVLNIFQFFDGEFRFQEISWVADQEFDLKISVPVLIEQGIKRMKFNSSLERFMAKKVPFPKREDFIYRLAKEEKGILEKINGKTSAEVLLHTSSISPVLFWKSLYLFYCLDLIDFEDEEKISEKEERVSEFSSGAPEQRIDGVMELIERLPSMDCYQILNLPRNASQADIKKAYFQLARKYHPDSFDRNLSPEIKKQVEDVFDYVTKAYHTLSSEEKGSGEAPRIDRSSGKNRKEMEKRAEIKFRKGKTLYDRGRYEEALTRLEEAVRINENKGDYFLLLAMAESKIPRFQKKAEEDFLKVQKIEPWNTESYVGLGLLYKQEGLSIKARKQFRRALEIDSGHKIARREMESSRKAGKRKGLKGIFSFDFLGKKSRK